MRYSPRGLRNKERYALQCSKPSFSFRKPLALSNQSWLASRWPGSTLPSAEVSQPDDTIVGCTWVTVRKASPMSMAVKMNLFSGHFCFQCKNIAGTYENASVPQPSALLVKFHVRGVETKQGSLKTQQHTFSKRGVTRFTVGADDT